MTGKRPSSVPVDVVARGVGSPIERDPYTGEPRGTKGAVVAQGTYSSPREVRPRGGRDFFRLGTVVALAAAAGETEVAEFTVNGQNVGVVKSLTFLINNMTLATDIVFKVRIDSGAVEGWDQIRVGPRAATNIAVGFVPEETTIDIPLGGRVVLTAQVFDAAAYQLSASMKGWQYSKTLWERWEGVHA